jgi:hypothetical protein
MSISAYLLIVACFLCALFGMIASTRSVRTASLFLWMALLVSHRWIVSFPERFEGFLFASIIPAAIIAHFVIRRRLTLPCVVVEVPHRTTSAFVASLLIIFFSIVLVDSRDISLILMVATVVFFLIYASYQRFQICGNGIWSWGTLHSWDEYESYFWTTRDHAAVVILKQRQKFREAFASRLVRLTVPPESVEAVKQLLEANLPNSSEAPETVKA